MFKINTNSNTVIIVLHEIYGINQHIKSFCEKIAKEDFDVICPNLLDRETPFEYSQEHLAYEHFIQNIGFPQASLILEDILMEIKSLYNKVFIIGFSIGATVAWLSSESENVDGIVGFYGSRIRNYVHLKPRCPILLFFPRQEKSFDVDGLIATLCNKEVQSYKLKGEHGFSDPFSPKYDPESDQITYQELINFIKSYR